MECDRAAHASTVHVIAPCPLSPLPPFPGHTVRNRHHSLLHRHRHPHPHPHHPHRHHLRHRCPWPEQRLLRFNLTEYLGEDIVVNEGTWQPHRVVFDHIEDTAWIVAVYVGATEHDVNEDVSGNILVNPKTARVLYNTVHRGRMVTTEDDRVGPTFRARWIFVQLRYGQMELAKLLARTYHLSLMRHGFQFHLNYSVGYADSPDGLLRAYTCAPAHDPTRTHEWSQCDRPLRRSRRSHLLWSYKQDDELWRLLRALERRSQRRGDRRRDATTDALSFLHDTQNPFDIWGTVDGFERVDCPRVTERTERAGRRTGASTRLQLLRNIQPLPHPPRWTRPRQCHRLRARTLQSDHSCEHMDCPECNKRCTIPIAARIGGIARCFEPNHMLSQLYCGRNTDQGKFISPHGRDDVRCLGDKGCNAGDGASVPAIIFQEHYQCVSRHFQPPHLLVFVWLMTIPLKSHLTSPNEIASCVGSTCTHNERGLVARKAVSCRSVEPLSNASVNVPNFGSYRVKEQRDELHMVPCRRDADCERLAACTPKPSSTTCANDATNSMITWNPIRMAAL